MFIKFQKKIYNKTEIVIGIRDRGFIEVVSGLTKEKNCC